MPDQVRALPEGQTQMSTHTRTWQLQLKTSVLKGDGTMSHKSHTIVKIKTLSPLDSW